MSKNQAVLDHQTVASSSQSDWTPIKPTIHRELPINDEGEEAFDESETPTYFAKELATDFSGLASDDREVLCDVNHIIAYLSEIIVNGKATRTQLLSPMNIARHYTDQQQYVMLHQKCSSHHKLRRQLIL